MDELIVLKVLSALGQETRLHIFRELMRAEPEGLAAGLLAERLGIVQNTLSAHLAHLAQAGLVVAERRGRLQIYRVQLQHLQQALQFLVQDCCHNRPELCAVLTTGDEFLSGLTPLPVGVACCEVTKS